MQLPLTSKALNSSKATASDLQQVSVGQPHRLYLAHTKACTEHKPADKEGGCLLKITMTARVGCAKAYCL
jgi:hypothetical protein